MFIEGNKLKLVHSLVGQFTFARTVIKEPLVSICVMHDLAFVG